MDRVKLNELKHGLIRTIIPYKDNDFEIMQGNEQEVLIWIELN